MGLIKIILAIAVTAAITIAITTRTVTNVEEMRLFKQQDTSEERPKGIEEMNLVTQPRKTKSRFLAQKEKKFRNPKPADHCNKNNEVCRYEGGANSTMACCNNKCIDLSSDHDNCGACRNRCEYTQACCRGQCVYLAYDKRHCGECNHRCPRGEYCVYGMCNYA